MAMRGRLERRVKPDWDSVKTEWDGCMRFLRSQGVPEDPAYGLSMATQELLENAVKYGAFGGGDAIDLTIDAGHSDVTIEVKSRAADQPVALKQLDDTIQWIRGYQSPFEAYVEKLKEVSARPYEPGQSGLGLARIAYEAQCILDFYIDATNTLAISAVYHRPGAAR